MVDIEPTKKIFWKIPPFNVFAKKNSKRLAHVNIKIDEKFEIYGSASLVILFFLIKYSRKYGIAIDLMIIVSNNSRIRFAMLISFSRTRKNPKSRTPCKAITFIKVLILLAVEQTNRDIIKTSIKTLIIFLIPN